MQETRGIRLPRLLLLLVALSATSAAFADVVGVFTEVEGRVTILRDDYYLAAAETVEVENQDLIETEADGSTQIEMVDGSILRLGSNSRLLLSEYQVTENKNVIAASLEVLSGWLRFAVAKLRSNDASYRFNAPTLAIGIRGTEGVIEADNERGSLFLEEGVVEVTAQDERISTITPVRVAAGQFVERRRGALFRHLRRPPAVFHSRLPTRLKQRLARRIGSLSGRRLPPRVLRRMTPDDVDRYLRRHAPMRKRLERRLKRSRRPAVQGRNTPLPSQTRRQSGVSAQQRKTEAVDRLIRRSSVRQRERRRDAQDATRRSRGRAVRSSTQGQKRTDQHTRTRAYKQQSTPRARRHSAVRRRAATRRVPRR